MSKEIKITNIPVANFGEIKDVYNNILAENIGTKDEDTKKLFKSYVKMISENEILRTQFLIYNSIENMVETDSFKAIQYIQESIDLMSKFSKKDIDVANLTLMNQVSFEKQNINEDKKSLYENIHSLIMTNKKSDTISIIVEARHSILEYLKGNTVKVISESIELPNSMLSSIMIEKYNEKYSTLTESEKELVKVLMDEDETKRLEVYTNTLRECIDLIDVKLKESDTNTKEKLLTVKDRLLNDKKDIKEDFIKNISKLVELKSSLS
jgi:hypothetical protein